MINTQYIDLDMTPSGVFPVLYCSQYDVGRPLGVIVHNGSEVVDLDTYTVTMHGTRTDGTQIVANVSTSDNVGVFVTSPEMTNKADRYAAQIVIDDANSNHVASLNFIMHVAQTAMDENDVGDKSLYQQYTDTVQSALSDLRSKDENLQAQINEIIAPTGEAPSAAEVENARIGADNYVYPTLGDAIRDQISDVKTVLNHLNGQAITWIDGAFIRESGARESASYSYTDYIALPLGAIVYLRTFMSTLARVCFYDADKHFITEYANASENPEYVLDITLPTNAAYVRASCLTANKGQFLLQVDLLNEIQKKANVKPGYFYVSEYPGTDDDALDAAIADAVAYDGGGTVVIDRTLRITYGHYISYNTTYYTGIAIISERETAPIELLQAKYMDDDYWDIICDSSLSVFRLFSMNCDRDGYAIPDSNGDYHDITYVVKKLRIKNDTDIDSDTYEMGNPTMDVIWHSYSTVRMEDVLVYGFRHVVHVPQNYSVGNENYCDFCEYRNITVLAPQGCAFISRHGDNDVYDHITILYASRTITEPLMRIIKSSNALINGVFIKCVTAFDDEVSGAAISINNSTVSISSLGMERNQFNSVLDIISSVVDIATVGQRFSAGVLMTVDADSKAHINGVSYKNISRINSPTMFTGDGVAILTCNPVIVKTVSDPYEVNANIIETLFSN